MREKSSDFKLATIERVQVEKIFKQKYVQTEKCVNRVYVQIENKREERSNVF